MLKVAWSPIYNHPLPPNHRFPMEKYDLLPQQLIHEGTISKKNLFEPERLSTAQILATHTADYWGKLTELNFSRAEERRSGFPLSKKLVERETTINGGTLQAVDFARSYGVSMNIAGGTHHAFTNRAEGFCLLNDIAIAAKWALSTGKATKVLVIDLDVHQGNGTAEIFGNNESVFTFSMHGEHNYPLQKERSDLDVALPDGIKDEPYLKLLEAHLDTVIPQVRPDLIFFQSGVDVLETDKLGRLGLSIEGCKERDRKVLAKVRDHGIPLVISMGGGYSKDIRHILEAHANTYRLAQELFF